MAARRTLLSTLFLLTVASSAAQATEATYQCDGGTRLTAVFSEPGRTPSQAVLRIAGAGGEITLPQVMSADGGRYASSTVEFWIKGTSATLTRDGKSEICVSK